MRTSTLSAIFAACALAAGCTSTSDVTMISADTYRTNSNAGLVFGGGEAATKAATETAERFCAAEHKHSAVTGVSIHTRVTRFMADVTFHCVEQLPPTGS